MLPQVTLLVQFCTLRRAGCGHVSLGYFLLVAAVCAWAPLVANPVLEGHPGGTPNHMKACAVHTMRTLWFVSKSDVSVQLIARVRAR
jgi:hypothetical protein